MLDTPQSLYGFAHQKFISLCFGSKKRHSFYQQLSMLLDVGIALHEALTSMRDKYAEYESVFKENWIEIAVLEECLHRMRLGYNSLSDLLYGYIPQRDRLMLGQGNSRIVEAINAILDLHKQFSGLKKDIVKFSATPFVVVLMVIGMLYGCYYLLFPQLLSIFTLNKMPLETRMLYSLTTGFVNYAPEIFVGAIVMIIAMTMSFAWLKGKVRDCLDWIIPYSMYKRLQGIAFLLTLSALIEAKLPFDEALGAMSKNASRYLLSFIEAMQMARQQGEGIGRALISAKLLPKNTRAAVDIFDQAQRFKEGLYYLAHKGLDQEISRIKSVFNAISLIALFVGIGFGIWLYFSVGDISLSLQGGNIST